MKHCSRWQTRVPQLAEGSLHSQAERAPGSRATNRSSRIVTPGYRNPMTSISGHTREQTMRLPRCKPTLIGNCTSSHSSPMIPYPTSMLSESRSSDSQHKEFRSPISHPTHTLPTFGLSQSPSLNAPAYHAAGLLFPVRAKWPNAPESPIFPSRADVSHNGWQPSGRAYFGDCRVTP